MGGRITLSAFFFFNDTATTEIYTLSLHDALPIFEPQGQPKAGDWTPQKEARLKQDRKSTRLNSSHSQISYAVFCLKKKKTKISRTRATHTDNSSSIDPMMFFFQRMLD